jgi:hypothetical protein
MSVLGVCICFVCVLDVRTIFVSVYTEFIKDLR